MLQTLPLIHKKQQAFHGRIYHKISAFMTLLIRLSVVKHITNGTYMVHYNCMKEASVLFLIGYLAL